MRGLFFPLFYVMVTADGRRRALSPMSAGIHPDLSIRIYCLSLPGSGRYPNEKHLTVNKNKKAFCRLLCYNKSTTRRQFLHLLEREGILQEKDKRNRSPGHLEDLALKSAADYFGDEMIHWLGIREKALRSAPTELVELETRHMYEDFLYEMENGLWYHFEFESDSISSADLRRFREYEASTARRIGAPVITYVICSSDVKHLKDSITEGINTYRVRLIRLKDDISDNVFARFAGGNAPAPTREDMIPVLLSPLMAGKMAQPERILQGIRILRSAESAFDPSEIRKMEAILYAFAVKFLNNEDLSKVKEAIVMTKLGQMIWEDAVNQGREEGTQIGQQQASERYSRLILLLDQEKKPELIIKAASDPAYREALYRKYGI